MDVTLTHRKTGRSITVRADAAAVYLSQGWVEAPAPAPAPLEQQQAANLTGLTDDFRAQSSSESSSSDESSSSFS